MKRKKILSGLVVVVVLLSGTTFLYFAGVERAGVTPALAMLQDGDCGPGGFCAVDLGMGGGCNPTDCCPPGASWCPGWNYRSPMAFQEVGSDPHGSCWTYNGSTAAYCSEKWCDNFYICPAAQCVAANPAFVRTATKPVAMGGTCGMERM
jgi:hypothetical protein